jgi:hypothetical protein
MLFVRGKSRRRLASKVEDVDQSKLEQCNHVVVILLLWCCRCPGRKDLSVFTIPKCVSSLEPLKVHRRC